MRLRSRAGFSLIEIMVAMGLTLTVFAITLPFVRAQTRALGTSAGRLDADQLARYAQRAVDRDLRLASAIPGQPLLVLAGPMSISFNSNLIAVDTSDPGAVDLDPTAATTLTDSWRLANAAALPLTARSYPTQDYLDVAGAISRIETISYFLHADTISGRSDIYVLFRRVNGRDSVEIVRGLHVPADSAFFSYLRPVSGTLTRVAAARLPLYWDSLAIDSIGTVGIRAAGYYKDRSTNAVTIRTVNWRTVIPNAVGRVRRTCGAAPTAPSAFTPVKVTTTPPYRVQLTWNASTDDNGGAQDVPYYVVEWRVASSGNTWQSLATVTARRVGTYAWTHANPRVIGNYEYGLRAADCGGLLSAQVVSASVTLP